MELERGLDRFVDGGVTHLELVSDGEHRRLAENVTHFGEPRLHLGLKTWPIRGST
jgi:hypothetical protein